MACRNPGAEGAVRPSEAESDFLECQKDAFSLPPDIH